MGNSDSKTGSNNNPKHIVRSTSRPEPVASLNVSTNQTTFSNVTKSETVPNVTKSETVPNVTKSETVSNVVSSETGSTNRNISDNSTADCEVLDHPGNSAAGQTNKKMAATIEDIENKLKKLNIKGRKDINILLLGETGVGKSTFINSIFNYLQFQDFETAEKANLNVLIPASFTVYDKDDKAHYIEVGSREDTNELLDVGTSATQSVKTYTFYINNGQTMVRLIDTPGMGDTRGIEQDDINCENILNYISRIHELHAICYLFKTQQSRATAYFKYCVAQILSRLEKSACENIVFVFTHSHDYSPGETYQLLKQVTEEISRNPAQAKIPLENNRFCFNNEAFTHLAAIKNAVELKKKTRRSCIDSWNKSTEQCWNMIQYILGLRPHFVKHTSAINEARRIIYQLAQPMADIAQLVNDNIYALENHQAHLNMDRQSLSELKKKLYIPVIDLEVTNLTQPVTVCTDLKCCEVYQVDNKKEWHYKTRCHDPCYLTNVPKDLIGSPELMNCASMGASQICTKCSHSYKVHMHVYYMTKKKHTQKRDDIVLQNINTKELVIENVLKIIQEIRERKSKLERELNVIVNCNAKFAHFLQNNAIAPFSDSYAEYINHLIIKERGLGSNADINKMAGLERLLREHNEMKKIFAQAADMQRILGKADEVTPQEINKAMQDLFKLELNGKKVKELYDSQKKSIAKEYNFSEYVHKGSFSQAAPKPQKDDQNKGKHSASNPSTKFQRGRQFNRGNQNNQRGRSAGPHHRNQRDRTPPPPYDSSSNAHRPNQGYPPAGPPQRHPNYVPQPYPPPVPHSPYPPPPPAQPPAAKKQDEKSPTIQVHVTLPTAAGGNDYPPRDPARDYPRDYPPRDPRDYPHPDPYRDYPRDYPPRDYPPRDYPPRDYPRDYNYPPRDPYPPRPEYAPRSDYPPRTDYPPRADYPPRTDYPPRADYPPRTDYPPRPDYPPRGDPRADYPPRDDYPPRPDYPPRANYPPQNDYPPRNYDPRNPSSSQYPANPPPQRPYDNQQSGNKNYQQNQNRRGQDNRGGNFRGRGNQNRGGINRKYRKKHDNPNSNNSGDESDTSVASSKK